jgi:cellulose synthase/poly-beta-1,6-N-acetylglucosamine synthase-like glycosyltransferase
MSNGIATSGPRVVKQRVFKWWDYGLYVPLTLIILAAMGWLMVNWFRLMDRGFASVAFWLATFILVYTFMISLFRWSLLPLMSRPAPMKAEPRWKVGVATTFVPGLESFDMLESTVEKLAAMDYPHDTWVLDEGDDDRVKALCARLGVFHFTRKGKAAYLTESGAFERKTKHGNYNAWLDAAGYARYDILIGFDPDHVPDRHFLDAALGYFNDPKIGYVQLPQVYYNQPAGFIARGAAEETYSYYSATQMSSYTFGFPIVTGCHNLHRRDALRRVGGFAPHDADDLLITLLYRGAGWQGVYVPEIHAKGLTPTDWPGYLAQQLRWARSVLDVKLRAFPKVAGAMPLPTRLMSFLHGFYYVQEGITSLAALLLLALMLATGVSVKFLTYDVVMKLVVVSLILQATDLYRQRFFLDPRHEWGLHWRAGFLRFAKWPYLLFGMIDAMTGRKRPYSLTAKVRTETRRAFMTWPHLVAFLALGGAWLAGLLQGHDIHPLLMLGAGIAMTSSLTVMWTETWRFPDPFDPKILKAELEAWLRPK